MANLAMCILVVLLSAYRLSMYEHGSITAKESTTSPRTIMHLLFEFYNIRFLDEPQFSLRLYELFLHSINSENIFRQCSAIFTFLKNL
jgi:hypothetical protein